MGKGALEKAHGRHGRSGLKKHPYRAATRRTAAPDRHSQAAQRHSGQPRHVANFLLVVTDAHQYGAWNPRYLLSVLINIADDMVTVVAALAYYDFSVYDLGLQDDFETIALQWRPES
ncbi:DUF7673 family protein [Noviherbaspirillum sp.]|uniref:DUF7673 family protein n=1 Tax=Noviherbaspirillum sp. TaxID=1926288 RepID=UPI003BEF3DEF